MPNIGTRMLGARGAVAEGVKRFEVMRVFRIADTLIIPFYVPIGQKKAPGFF